MRRVAVLDLGIGNLHSVAKALAAAGADVALVSAPFDAGAYDGLCVPGQGIFSVCVDRLASTGGDDMVRNWISSGKPYLGMEGVSEVTMLPLSSRRVCVVTQPVRLRAGAEVIGRPVDGGRGRRACGRG